MENLYVHEYLQLLQEWYIYIHINFNHSITQEIVCLFPLIQETLFRYFPQIARKCFSM